jgi:hypothetical protein
MKTQVKITNDDYGQTAYDNYIEDINYLVNEQNNVFCEIKNNRFTNIVEDEKNYSSSPDDYRNKTIIEAKGYTQGEWQDYVIYHNKPIQALKKQLKRSFTHFNGYCVEKSEYFEKDGKLFVSEPHDFTSFVIDWIEFPSDEEVILEYINNFGNDFDKIIYDNK